MRTLERDNWVLEGSLHSAIRFIAFEPNFWYVAYPHDSLVIQVKCEQLRNATCWCDHDMKARDRRKITEQLRQLSELESIASFMLISPCDRANCGSICGGSHFLLWVNIV